jgi:O-antigen/teichoic acid export membrane protein
LKRRSSKFLELLTYGLGTIANSAIGFVLLPIYMKQFTPADYGIINVFLLIITFATMFVSAGMMSAVHKLYFVVPEGDRRKLLGTTLTWYVAVAVVFALAVVPFRSAFSAVFFKTTQYQLDFISMLMIVVLSLIFDIPLNVLRLERRPGYYVGFSVLRLVSELSLKILFIVVLKRGIHGYFESSILSLAVSNLAIFLFVRRFFALSASGEYLRKLLKLGAPFIVTGFAVWSLNAADRVQLNFLLGASATGVYSVGLRFAQVFNVVFYRPISLLMPPLMLSDTSDDANTWRRYSRLLSILTLVGSLLAALLSLFSIGAIELITTVFGSHREYLTARGIIPMLTFSNLVYALTMPAGYLGLKVEKTQIFAYAGIVAAVANIALNFLLIRAVGMLGAAWATLLAFILYAVIAFALVNRVKEAGFNYLANAGQLALSFAAVMVLTRVSMGNALLSLVLKSLILVGVCALSAWKISGLLGKNMMKELKSLFVRA